MEKSRYDCWTFAWTIRCSLLLCRAENAYTPYIFAATCSTTFIPSSPRNNPLQRPRYRLFCSSQHCAMCYVGAFFVRTPKRGKRAKTNQRVLTRPQFVCAPLGNAAYKYDLSLQHARACTKWQVSAFLTHHSKDSSFL